MSFTYDYTKTMMMKLLMAVPDRKGGSKIIADVDKAIEIIRKVDNITLGTPKIIYLVGWQYLGHDDKYPAFFEVNEGIKRACDNSARDSLLWLIEEAKKYNTVVSLHINFADAYEDSPIFEEYVKNNALIRNAKGKPAKIEKYNNKACYKISYKEEWESGLFKKRVDRLFELLPIEQMDTVHVDNFQCYVNRNPYVSAEEMIYYRNKMIEYLSEKGVDITSEFTYREGKGSKALYGRITRDVTPHRYPIACLGAIPAVWWVDKMKLEEYFAYYPHIYGGGMPKSNEAFNLFYGNIHGEDLFLKEDWESEFIKYFIAVNVPFFYLNGKQRVGFVDKSMNRVKYADGTVTSSSGVIVDSRAEIVKSGRLKVTNMGKVSLGDCKVFLPYKEGYMAYSSFGGSISGKIDGVGDTATVSQISGQGLVNSKQIPISNGVVAFEAKANTGYFIKIK